MVKACAVCLYSAVSSSSDRSKRVTLHHLADRFIPAPILWETFIHSAITKTIRSHFLTLIYIDERTVASWREQKCPSFERGLDARLPPIENPTFYHGTTTLHTSRPRIILRVRHSTMELLRSTQVGHVSSPQTCP